MVNWINNGNGWQTDMKLHNANILWNT